MCEIASFHHPLYLRLLLVLMLSFSSSAIVVRIFTVKMCTRDVLSLSGNRTKYQCDSPPLANGGIAIFLVIGYCFTPYQRLWLYNGAPLVAFYDTLGIRRRYSRLKPSASSRGNGGIAIDITLYIRTTSLIFLWGILFVIRFIFENSCLGFSFFLSFYSSSLFFFLLTFHRGGPGVVR